MWPLLALLACTPPEDPERRPQAGPDGTSGPVAPEPGATLATEDTGGVPPAVFDCGDVLPPPFPRDRFDIVTEEDFDFDANGFLIHQDWSNLIAVDMYGAWKLISPNVNQDPAGVQVLSTGDIAVADPDAGTLELYDPVNGGHEVVASGFSQINGLEVGANDRIYYSEMTTSGYVGWVEPYTDTHGIVATGIASPNGLALSPDEQTLYVASGLSAANSYVLAVDLVGPDTWSEPRMVLKATNDTFDAIEVDSCGAVYTVGFSGGLLLRTWPDLGFVEEMGVLTGDGYAFSSMRFGNGIGGWQRDTLYVTDRGSIYSIDVDVPGRPHPTNPEP